MSSELSQTSIKYYLNLPNPATHYFEIKIHIHLPAHPKDTVDLKMPVWTPGSYLVREYPRFVEGFSVQTRTGDPLIFKKISKNTWRIFPSTSAATGQPFEITYRVYAFDLTVRTAFLDASQAYINGAALWMWVEGYEHQQVAVYLNSPEHWKIATSLPARSEDGRLRMAENFDALVDSPILMGVLDTFEIKDLPVPHHYAIYGSREFDRKRLIEDTRKIILAAIDIFDDLPISDYIFLVHFVAKNGGGLEHKNSCSLLFSRLYFKKSEGYKRFLSLVAHEYFHLWNVKRLRPSPLGPFDYEKENYCELLWFAEGFTSYYEKVILLKAALIDSKEWLKVLSTRINYVENQPGNEVQSLRESSMDTWIKAYRPHENSFNSTISYYTKGALIAMMLDSLIIQHSGAKHSLDDVMQEMYLVYYKQLDRPFEEEELKACLEKYARVSLDAFFEKFIYGREAIPYEEFLSPLGLVLSRDESEEALPLGMEYKDNFIQKIYRDSPAEQLGLNVGDEIVSINGLKSDHWADFLTTFSEGQRLSFQLIRDQNLLNLEGKKLTFSKKDYQVREMTQKNESQEKAFAKWLRKEI